MSRQTRRRFVHSTGLAAFGLSLASPVRAMQPSSGSAASAPPDWLHQQDPAMVKELVTVAHSDVKRVRELVEKHPALANAAVDWGFGDWEDAAGPPPRTPGSREIADLLLSHGARISDLRRRDAGAARCRQGVHRGAAGRSADVGPARHHADGARQGGRSRRRRRRDLPRRRGRRRLSSHHRPARDGRFARPLSGATRSARGRATTSRSTSTTRISSASRGRAPCGAAWPTPARSSSSRPACPRSISRLREWAAP